MCAYLTFFLICLFFIIAFVITFIEIKSEVSICKTTATNTEVNILSLSSEDCDQAIAHLEKELMCLLNKNTEKLELDLIQTETFEVWSF